MRKGIACLVIILCAGLPAVAPCYYSDSPDCSCFDNTAAWNPSGTWIQDIALDTVGTIVSCVPDGGKPYYQMQLGLNSPSSATSMAFNLGTFSVMPSPSGYPYQREAWCSETISYWHHEAGIPYSRGYRRNLWNLDWRLPNTEAIRTFYLVEEALTGGRGRWIQWSSLDYSDFQPGINAPAPGSYVLIRKYDDATSTWIGGSHSMMINEMTIHLNEYGDVVEVEVSLLDGNGGSPARVRDTSTIDDLLSYTPAGSEWLSNGRKILGFGVDLHSNGSPIYDPDRLHFQTLSVLAKPFKPFLAEDPLWSHFYEPLVQELVEYAKKSKDGPNVTGPSSVIGRGGIPDGQTVSWVFEPAPGRTQPEGIQITIDLLQDHPLLLEGIILCWEGTVPTGYSVRYAADGQRYQEIAPPAIRPLALLSRQTSSVLVPISFGEESSRVRMIQMYFPPGSLSGEAKLDELRFIYDWGPSEDAEFNP